MIMWTEDWRRDKLFTVVCVFVLFVLINTIEARKRLERGKDCGCEGVEAKIGKLDHMIDMCDHMNP